VKNREMRAVFARSDAARQRRIRILDCSALLQVREQHRVTSHHGNNYEPFRYRTIVNSVTDLPFAEGIGLLGPA